MRRENELVFRAYDGREMKNVLKIDFLNGVVCLEGNFWKTISNVSLMQCTGIKSDNRYIYEGDIVSVNHCLCVVAIEKSRLELINLADDTITVLGEGLLEGKVVGNIHENPELVRWAKEKGEDTVDLQGQDEIPAEI